MDYKKIDEIIYHLRSKDTHSINLEYIKDTQDYLNEYIKHYDDITDYEKSKYYFLCMLLKNSIKTQLNDDANITKAISLLNKSSISDKSYEAILYGYLSNYHTFNSNIELSEKMYKLANDMIDLNCDIDELIEFNLRHLKILIEKQYSRLYISKYVDKIHEIIKNNNSNYTAKYYCDISQIHTKVFDNVVGAIFYLSQALDLVINYDDKDLEARIRIFLAISYTDLSNYSKSVSYLEPMVNNLKYESINGVYKLTILNNLISNYLKLNDYENANKYINYIDNKYIDENLLTKDHLKAMVYICKAQYYLRAEQEKTKDVIEYINKSKILCIENRYKEVFKNLDISINKVEGNLYFELKDYDKAYKLHIEGLKKSIQRRENKLIMDFYELLYKDFEQINDYKSATYTLKKWIKLKEKWFEEQNNKYSEILLKEHDIYIKEDKILELSYIKNNLVDKVNKDGLTGLLNRHFLENYICENQYKENESVSALMIDIDYFKEYNDIYGHVKGDEALINISKVLVNINNVITKNIDEDKSKAIRYGGEEFLLLIEDMKYEDIVDLANHIIDEINNLDIEHTGSKISSKLTVSIGISRRDSSIIDYEYIIDLADKALYKAKLNGRDRYEYIKNTLSFN